MDRFIKPILLAMALLVFSCSAVAQEPADVPRKNPFAQPDILIFKKPSPSAATGKRATVPQPLPELQLTATLISISEPMVLVNGTLLNVGDTIEGMTLTVVDEGRAVFRFRGKNHVYTIEEDKRGQTR